MLHATYEALRSDLSAVSREAAAMLRAREASMLRLHAAAEPPPFYLQRWAEVDPRSSTQSQFTSREAALASLRHLQAQAAELDVSYTKLLELDDQEEAQCILQIAEL